MYYDLTVHWFGWPGCPGLNEWFRFTCAAQAGDAPLLLSLSCHTTKVTASFFAFAATQILLSIAVLPSTMAPRLRARHAGLRPSPPWPWERRLSVPTRLCNPLQHTASLT